MFLRKTDQSRRVRGVAIVDQSEPALHHLTARRKAQGARVMSPYFANRVTA